MMQREASELATWEFESPDLAELGLEEEIVEETEDGAEAAEVRTGWAGVAGGAWSLRSDGRRRADDEDEEDDEVEDEADDEEEEDDFDDDLDEDFDDDDFDDDEDDEEEDFDDDDDD